MLSLRGIIAARSQPARECARAYPGQADAETDAGCGRAACGLGVVPTEVVNAADGWPVLDAAVWSARVVVLEPVWQGSVAVVT
jgi:hypothetical protein